MRSALFQKRLIFIFFSAIFFLVLLFFHFRGVIYYDEGYILNSSLRVLHGQIPYRDFDFVYTPLSFLFTSIFLKIFGVSVFAGRLAALTVSLLSLFALYKILNLITKNNYIVVISLLFFIGWGPAHVNFPWPTMFSVCAFLYTILFYHQGINQKNKNYFFFSGVMTIVTFLAKQNFGAGILLVVVCLFWFLKFTNKKTFLAQYFFGMFSVSLLTLIYFVSTSSLIPFLQNMYLYTFKRVLVQKTLDTPFLYEGNIEIKLIKLLIYSSPLILSIVAFFSSLHSKKKLFIIPLFVGVFYLFGIRPTTDYDHLVPLLAISCLPFVIIITSVKNIIVSRIFLFILILLTIVGFYTAYFSGYYKWDAPLRDHSHFSNNPRLLIYLTKNKGQESEDLIKYVDSQTRPTDYIFVNYYSPLIYFLTNRQNPSRYDLISPMDLPVSYQNDTINVLKKQKVQLIIMNDINKKERSPVANFVNKNYRIGKKIGDWIVFLKK